MYNIIYFQLMGDLSELKNGVAQWVRSLDLATHTSLSAIFTSNMRIHIIRSNRVSKLWLNDVFVSTFAAFNKRHTTLEKNALLISLIELYLKKNSIYDKFLWKSYVQDRKVLN
jgi:hypothetical protein